jgi:3-phosphoshikimate 1-carboxyvinyltransferase
MGIQIDDTGNKQMVVHGRSGKFSSYDPPIFLGNSGTSMRLLTALTALGEGTYVLSGTDRMHERPIDDLLGGLAQAGVAVRSINRNGCPPVEIKGGFQGGRIRLNCSISSQFLSALLLVAPHAKELVDISITHGPVSKPYIDLTIDIMKDFGIEVNRDGYNRFQIPTNQIYRPGSYSVEPDCSQAGYFWGAAAVTGSYVKVKGINKHSRQGDVRFVDVLEKMGCDIVHEKDGIGVKGGPLTGIDIDMGNMPDLVPTLAVIAAFAGGTTHVYNVAHLRAKESDRLGSVVKELKKMGVEASCTDNELNVKGGHPRGAEIKTYDDHRMAMSFAIAGLKVPGVVISDEMCVQKSFPDFWEVFETLYGV